MIFAIKAKAAATSDYNGSVVERMIYSCIILARVARIQDELVDGPFKQVLEYHGWVSSRRVHLIWRSPKTAFPSLFPRMAD